MDTENDHVTSLLKLLQERSVLRIENEQLRIENEELRKLLSITYRTDDESQTIVDLRNVDFSQQGGRVNG